jgi:cytochrome P450
MTSDAGEIIGALLTPGGRADPYPLYARAHELGPVSVIGDGWFVIPGYAAINGVLRNPAFGIYDPQSRQTRRPGRAGHPALASMRRSILQANPPDHGRMRSVMSSAFTPRRVTALQPAITAAVDSLLDELAAAGAGGGLVDFMEQFAFRLPVTVICELLGVPHADRHRFRRLAADLTAALELRADAKDLGPADAAAAELGAYFTRLIADRRAAPGDDLISALVAACDAGDGRLSDDELLANLIMLLVAGFETTTNLLGNGLALLFDYPAAAAALRSGRLPVPAFVEEVLRYDSPVQLTSRVALADDLVVAGVPVPRSSEVILLLGAANRDPGRYQDPDRFDPTRIDSQPLSFGVGAHFCLGNGLARLEASTAFPRLLARFPGLAPAPGSQPARRDRLVLRGYETLPVALAGGLQASTAELS